MFRYFAYISTMCITLFISGVVLAAPPPGKGKPPKGGGGGGATEFSIVKSKDWNEVYVRRVLNAFAYGGLATDAQIDSWGRMKPLQAVTEILTFAAVNNKLSPPDGGDDTELHCGSLADLQEFWSSNEPGNVMNY